MDTFLSVISQFDTKLKKKINKERCSCKPRAMDGGKEVRRVPEQRDFRERALETDPGWRLSLSLLGCFQKHGHECLSSSLAP